MEARLFKMGRLPLDGLNIAPLQKKWMCGLYSVNYLLKRLGKTQILKGFKPGITYNTVTAPMLGFGPFNEFGIGARLKESGLETNFKSCESIEELIGDLDKSKFLLALVFRDNIQWKSTTEKTAFGPHWVVIEDYNEFNYTTGFFQVYDPDQGKVWISKEVMIDALDRKPIKKSRLFDLARKPIGYYVIADQSKSVKDLTTKK